MDVIKFTVHPRVQQMLHHLQVGLVDEPYDAFGRTIGSWEGYTLMFRNGFPSKDLRKPCTDVFQEYCEAVYCPILFAMLYGSGWHEIQQHWSQFKSCTIKVSESADFWGENIFHMHIDGKIGLLQKNNHSQSRMSRMLFSIVTDTLDQEVDVSAYEYGTTVYPLWQPKVGFKSNHQFHNYMQQQYYECGLENSGLPRPHYRIPEELVYRATAGEVLWHDSHVANCHITGPQPIHAEPNPCPDRHLFVFDWKNLIHQDASGKYLPSDAIPMESIMQHFSVLAEWNTPLLKARLAEVVQVATELLPKAELYPGGRGAVETLIQQISDMLSSMTE